MGRKPIKPGESGKTRYPFKDRRTREQLRADPHMSRIFETLFQVDIWENFKRLKAALRVGVKHRDYATLMKALDDAEDNFSSAHTLLVNAKMLAEQFAITAQPIEGAMRSAATTALQAEKTAGTRSKAITDADVLAQCATMYDDEWQKLMVDKRQHKLTVDHLENLVECWKSRCRSLQTMVAKVR